MRASTLALLAALLCCSPLLVACGGGVDPSSDENSLENAKKNKCQTDHDCHNGQVCQNHKCVNPAPQCTANANCTNGQVCLSGKCQACTTDNQCNAGQVCQSGACGTPNGGPSPNPPPASCDQRHAGVTSIQILLTVNKYKGLIHGRNGTHEVVDGTISKTVWVFDQSVVDTQNVETAMNVKSTIDPSGLPQEIPLAPGTVIELEGEYIPASTANASGNAILHYTHSPCGYVVINGTKYQ